MSFDSIDKIRENGFELKKKRSRRHPAKTIIDADYADDIALLANTPNQAEGVMRGCPRGVMVKAMNCGIVVREFVLQSRYYVHFRANTLGKGMNPLILPPAMDK